MTHYVVDGRVCEAADFPALNPVTLDLRYDEEKRVWYLPRDVATGEMLFTDGVWRIPEALELARGYLTLRSMNRRG